MANRAHHIDQFVRNVKKFDFLEFDSNLLKPRPDALVKRTFATYKPSRDYVLITRHSVYITARDDSFEAEKIDLDD